MEKVKKGLSAGRVQSVAVRLITEREEEIENFVPEEYWTIDGIFSTESGEIRAKLARWEGNKPELATAEQTQAVSAQLKAFHIRSKVLRKKNAVKTHFLLLPLQLYSRKPLEG